MRLASVALCLTVAVASFPRDGRCDSNWYEHLSAAGAALARQDFAAAAPELITVDSIVGGHPGSMFALATIAANQGDRAATLRWLREFAATGLARHVTGDARFARLAGDSDFVAVAARLDSNATPLAKAQVAVRLDDPSLLAEDVAWDASRRRFLVSSIHHSKIVAVTVDGKASDFATAGPEAWGIYGLALDVARARLWATTAAGATCENYDAADSGRTALLAYDLRDGKRLTRVELPRDGAKHVLGDLTLARDGTVYVTESLGGGVYRLRPGATALDTMAQPGTFRSPQMPVLATDGRRLLIPDYARGLAALDIASGRVRWLTKPRTLASGGIDGLYRDGHRLLAIQNGTSPHRLLELTLNPSETGIVSWRVLEQASEWLGEPNHGTFQEGDFYFIGNSGWERVGEDEVLQTPADARPAVLLKLSRR
jgi:sugar lactone lactonase YvrE